MTKRNTPIPESKIKLVEELVNLIKNNKTVLIASIKNIPGSQFQEISKKLRGKAIVKVPKKSLIFRAIDNYGNKEIIKLKDKIDGHVAIVFSNEDSFNLSAELLESKSPSKAKPGQEAPTDIEVEAGMTELVPGPAISELGAVGLQVKVTNGKLEIVQNKVIVKEGQKISQGAADVMSKLDIRPFSIGFIPLAGFDTKEGKVYLEINIDKEGTLENLKYAYGKAFPFAVNIGYFSKDTVGFILAKAVSHERRLIKVITGEPDEPVLDEKVEEAPAEEKKEEKEEPKADASAGLASLFG